MLETLGYSVVAFLFVSGLLFLFLPKNACIAHAVYDYVTSVVQRALTPPTPVVKPNTEKAPTNNQVPVV